VDVYQEQRLVERAQQGDSAAVGELYEAYADRIFRYFTYRVDSRQVAEDLTGEVFVRFIEGLPNYEYRTSPLLAWLYQIAHARLVDHYRQSQKSRYNTNIEDITISTDEDLDTKLMLNYNQQRVRAAIKQLTEEQQQVILLRFIEGLNVQETADTMGKTTGSIKVMQHRALNALARFLVKQDATPI
jgi:RNA polymerase sigma-70 factor, ECF subfamily